MEPVSPTIEPSPEAPIQESSEKVDTSSVAVLEVNETTLKETLTAVFDPELHLNIVELGLVYGVTLKPKPEPAVPDVTVQMTLTSPACPYGPVILGQVPMVIKSKYQERVGEVDVDLVFTPPWDPATMASEDVKMELGIW